ncbi:hypothetical protein N6H13_22825 [Paenibacillus sp. CC-CFT742]|nr:hypothetical protein [Paenibacillus sp. CC-CFT742]WJH27951.1 hypothetical protein N6H13_22825 [Paenibacillus sp. CC-CFT742]
MSIRYFHANESIAGKVHHSIPDILTTVAQRYIGDHPKHSFCSGPTIVEDSADWGITVTI